MVRHERVDGDGYRCMVRGAAARLRAGRAHVDALNVFPVPDGDTGHNMLLTLEAALAEAEGYPDGDLAGVSEAVARGALRGARGNSGVILSQLLRGMAAAFAGLRDAPAPVWARALAEAAEAAYGMVMRPVEGTILTVARAAAEEAGRAAAAGGDVAAVLSAAAAAAAQALARTPELLPLLRRAGVVDAGGQGLVYVLEGMRDALTGASPGVALAGQAPPPRVALRVDEELARIPYPYDVELLVRGNPDASSLRRVLASLGDSVLVVPAEGGVKVHVHTDRPGKVLEVCREHGELDDVQVLDMRLQHAALVAAAGAPALVALAPGEGLAAVLRSLGAAAVVGGPGGVGPSAEEVARAADATGARHVIVLPNGADAFLACRQAAELCRATLHVLPTRSVPEGIAAAMAFSPARSLEENVRAMERAARSVRSGAVTRAARDVEGEAGPVRAGQAIGLVDDRIAVVGEDPESVLLELVQQMAGGDRQVVTVYYGEMVSEEQARGLAQALASRLPGADVEVLAGGQPHYHYLVSVE